ncbi:hypothetical protein [Allocoleopsis sp.]|uniref:hypothetical protein n=1 Tax=Allocoleopsis sp. TaxID=3088169 RepID=UPI002FD4F363
MKASVYSKCAVKCVSSSEALISFPTFPATLATPQSAAVIAECDRCLLPVW